MGAGVGAAPSRTHFTQEHPELLSFPVPWEKSVFLKTGRDSCSDTWSLRPCPCPVPGLSGARNVPVGVRGGGFPTCEESSGSGRRNSVSRVSSTTVHRSLRAQPGPSWASVSCPKVMIHSNFLRIQKPLPAEGALHGGQ